MRLLSGVLVGLLTFGCWSEYDPQEASGFDGYCAPLNCVDLLHIHIEQRDHAPFSFGAYTFSVETSPEVMTEITCTLSETGALCDGVPYGASVSMNAANTTFTIRIEETPQKLLVTAYFEGEELGSALLVPEYDIVAQSDPSCGEICYEGYTLLKTISTETL